MSDFEATYKGVKVPGSILDDLEFRGDLFSGFTAGVDAALQGHNSGDQGAEGKTEEYSGPWAKDCDGWYFRGARNRDGEFYALYHIPLSGATDVSDHAFENWDEFLGTWVFGVEEVEAQYVPKLVRDALNTYADDFKNTKGEF